MTALVRYGVIFILARAALFVVPLLLSNLLSAANYGTIEFVQAAAATLALLLGLGLNNLVPLIVIRKQAGLQLPSLLALLLALSGTIGIISVVLFFANGFSILALALLSTSALMLQGYWSVSLKSNAQNELSLLTDTGFWCFCLGGGAITSFCFSSIEYSTQLTPIYLAIGFYSLTLWTLVAKKYLSSGGSFCTSHAIVNLRSGIPLMFLGLLSILVASSGRLILGMLEHTETVGVYSAIFRVTSAPIIAHQITSVAMFQRYFSWPESSVNKFAGVPTLATSVFVSGMLLFLPHLNWVFGPAFASAYTVNHQVAEVLLAQGLIWSAISVNDTLANRAQAAGRVFRFGVSYIAVCASLALYLVKLVPNFTLLQYTYVQAGFVLGYFIVQSVALSFENIRTVSFWVLTVAAFVAMIAATSI